MTGRGSSVVAHRIDGAAGDLFAAIDFRGDWRERIVQLATRAEAGGD